MLEIQNLHVSVDGKNILKGIDLTVRAGEVHAIMGPNGSGKSTLSHVLAGRENFEIQQGRILFEGKDLTTMKVDERAHAGIFLAMQYPAEIPGVSNVTFLKAMLNAKLKAQGLTELDAMDFLTLVKSKLSTVGMDQDFLYRAVNEGFSGGEKKRNEVLQMAVLEPKLAVLDEIDSGLDVDALKTVAEGINNLRDPHRALIVVTHYQRLLNYIIPDYVHILINGQIVKSGDKHLASRVEEKGYGELTVGA